MRKSYAGTGERKAKIILDTANKRRIYSARAARLPMATSPILRSRPATLRHRRADAKQTSLTLFPQAARHGNCESPSGASAPPPVPDRRTKPATELVGIARLAASSPCADAKRRTEYFLLPVKSIL